MRYENWDVLLFPGGSKAPLQEFKTQCFVTKDTDSPYLQLSTMMGPPQRFPVQGNIGQSPVLTSFIPSLCKGTPFRVSVHNWAKPEPSEFMETFMQPEDVLTFEVRVFIDGVLSAGAFFGQRSSWPYVIDFGHHLDRNGSQDFLRFPAFHAELLDHQYWDAGDPFGRIKVVIAEGFARPNRSPPFERFKDVITMSFQHAPLQVLEHSGIAWPNPHMWSQDGSSDFKYTPMTEFSVRSRDETAHGHSPTRPEPRLLPSSMTHPHKSQEMAYGPWATNRAFPVPASQWQRSSEHRRWGISDSYLEPFLGEHGLDSLINEEAWIHRGARSSREDVPMPDYSISSGSRAISSMTGISYEHSKQPSIEAIMDDDQYNELLQSLTPTKPPIMGTRAPSNTPSAGPVTTPPNMSALSAPAKPSGTVEVRSARRARGSARGLRSAHASALREISRSTTRDVSGSTNKSNVPSEKATTPSKLGMSPSGNIKGKKEGPNENTKISPKRTPQKDTIDEPVRTSPQDGQVNEDENPGDEEKENAVHMDGDVLSACIV